MSETPPAHALLAPPASSAVDAAVGDSRGASNSPPPTVLVNTDGLAAVENPPAGLAVPGALIPVTKFFPRREGLRLSSATRRPVQLVADTTTSARVVRNGRRLRES